MLVSYNWLQKYFTKALPEPLKLAELFSFHSFEVESVKKTDDEKDTLLDLKVLPDRAHYALCHRGIAYEVSAVSEDYKMTDSETKDVNQKKEISKPKIEIKEPDLCLRYVAQKVEGVGGGVNNKKWEEIKKPLKSIGQKSINPIVDAANYVMFDIGQPLHAFDADKLDGGIIIRKANTGEKITTLDNKQVDLDSDILVIADQKSPLAIAGIKGGKKAEVDNKTKNLILESANFKASSIRKSSQKINIRTDASKRFENEITPFLAEEAIKKLSSLILELYPKAQASEITDEKSKEISQLTEIQTSFEYIDQRLGVSVPKKEILNILKKLNCIVSGSDDEIKVIPPPERLDLNIAEDLVDEIGRIYGYDKIKSKIPNQEKEKEVNKVFYYTEKIKDILVESGFFEVSLYSLVSSGDLEVLYPLASDKKFLRKNLSAGIVENLDRNERNTVFLGLNKINIFEVGNIFTKDGEKTNICLGVKFMKKIKNLLPEDVIKNSLKIVKETLEIDLSKNAVWKINNSEKSAVCEFNLNEIVEKMSEPKNGGDIVFTKIPEGKKYENISNYPFIVRDISVFMPDSSDQNELIDIVKQNGTELLLKTYIFDVFTKKTEDGQFKKSCACRLIFQSFDRTLEEGEVNKVMEGISLAISKKGWVIR